jgi:hypothetical protein
MKKPQFLTRRIQYILIGLALAILMGICMWLVRDIARQQIAIPLSYVLWVGDIVFRIVSQVTVWTIFLMVVSFMAIRSLLRSKSGQQKYRPVRKHSRGRVHELTKLINFAQKWQYSHWNLAHYVAELEIDVLALHGHGDPREIQHRLREGAINMDEEILSYFQLGVSKYALPEPKSLITRLKERCGFVQPAERSAPIDLERVVAFLEHQLEISHEHETV